MSMKPIFVTFFMTTIPRDKYKKLYNTFFDFMGTLRTLNNYQEPLKDLISGLQLPCAPLWSLHAQSFKEYIYTVQTTVYAVCMCGLCVCVFHEFIAWPYSLFEFCSYTLNLFCLLSFIILFTLSSPSLHIFGKLLQPLQNIFSFRQANFTLCQL